MTGGFPGLDGTRLLYGPAEQQQFFQTCAFQIAQAFEQLVTMARLRQVSASDFRRIRAKAKRDCCR